MGRTLTAILISGIFLNAGCSFSMPKLGLPRVHRITVQQGNVITQQMVDQLKPGMTRSQVAYVMGEPIFRNSFDDDRWDYIYTVEVPGIFNNRSLVSLFFENGALAFLTGNYAPTEAQPDTAPGQVFSTDSAPSGDEAG